MALYRKIDAYLARYYESSKSALLVTGARQTGKTYSIRRYGEVAYESFIEINFIEQPRAKEIFKDFADTKDILLRLSAFTGIPLRKDRTLIFFDEVQECPEAVTAIKFLVDEGSYRYILSGSLLGVELNDLRSEPVGYIGIKELYPLDFEEFVLNLGLQEDHLRSLKTSFREKREADPVLHQKMLQAFRLYLVIGGMPAAVNAYKETNNLQNVLLEQENILRLYKKDIAKYARDRKLRIEEIFSLIPSELNAKNKRFILKRLNEHAKFRLYEEDFLWLKDAGVAIPVYNVEEPKAPLLLAKSRSLFKLFQSDVGLLCAQYADGMQLGILSGETALNFGAVFENFVAQELLAHGFVPYYFNSKKHGEIDFVVHYRGQVLPIEVKSGKDYVSHRALSNVLKEENYGIKEAIVFTVDNIRQEDSVLYAPVYMVMFLDNEVVLPADYRFSF